MKLSDVKKAEAAIRDLPRDEIPSEENNDSEIHELNGAERFMNLQDKVITMLPEDEFPKTAAELLALNNLIYQNIHDLKSDIPREVIRQWQTMAPTRKKREVENPFRYT